MKRRNFIQAASAIAATTAITGAAKAEENNVYKWNMITTWPKNFPGVGTSAEFLAKKITEITNGQVEVTVYGADELVPSSELPEAISNGTAQMGYGASYYWAGKNKSMQFFSSVPFGMTADEFNSWLYFGGGMELWQETCKDFGVLPLAASNSGVQMVGWFNKEINSVEDLKGLKMRISGLGGEVVKQFGATPVSNSSDDIFISQQSGNGTTEFVGPHNDLVGLRKTAKYYYPGWQEPSTVIETIVNKEAMDELPEHLQSLVKDATRFANQEILAKHNAQSSDALDKLINDHGVILKKFPSSVLQELKEVSDKMIAEHSRNDPMACKVYDSYVTFLKKSERYANVSSRAYLNTRMLG